MRVNWLPFVPMDTQDRIVIDPNICHGKPVIRGTRVPVTVVVGSLAGGMTFEEVEREYDLALEDIRAALKFVGDSLNRSPSILCRRARSMRFLIDANLPRSIVEVVVRLRG